MITTRTHSVYEALWRAWLREPPDSTPRQMDYVAGRSILQVRWVRDAPAAGGFAEWTMVGFLDTAGHVEWTRPSIVSTTAQNTTTFEDETDARQAVLNCLFLGCRFGLFEGVYGLKLQWRVI